MIKIVFFAALRERLNCSELQFEATAAQPVSDILQQLAQRSAQWQQALASQQVLCAVNQQLCPPGTQVQPGDELALFPPVTGG